MAARLAILTVGLVLLASGAAADAIDGEWCSDDGARSFRIAGPRIETSSGVRTDGDYSRHAFSYVVPDGFPDAGARVDMRLLNEEEVRVFFDPSKPELWRRCKPTA